MRAAARVLVAGTVLVFAGLGVGAVVTTLEDQPARAEPERARAEPLHADIAGGAGILPRSR